ncbi:GntR family transcriptional regulator [Phreatobacter cathodiphilus]|uniref:GntR family transcriptional regulator n=1 Tax=Phreatobacter cathodiphilus TaxID=1868589 RepID=A0A2S0NCI1_9HYPH|nr:FCD domain-containing protein [Phreatobacter cathodiphilus]AVO45879.1 GntR family transcriptional regulator [Phreatobacter cathodiphilus]
MSPDLFTSAGESAYKRIRTDIITGRLAPGRRLRLDALRHDYGASISTLRETLNRLVSEKLVVAEGQRGFEVGPISAANLREIAALRQLLECHALRQSFAQGDLEWEARVIAAHHKLAQMEARMASGDRTDTDLWKRYDWQFHQALVSACGSQVLMHAHAAIFERYLRYQMIALSYRGAIAAAEHLAMKDAALRRDADEGCALLERHIAGGVDHALATGVIS